MFDVPVDAWYVWLGVAATSLVVFGVAVGLPHGTPPDATSLARAVDAVAVGPAGSTGEHPLEAERIRVGPHRVGVAGPGGSAHATFAYGPVTPARSSEELTAVVDGQRPSRVFATSAAFGDAVARARERTVEWRPAPDRLTIRRVTWGDVDATLVG